jgi:NADH dehydrogenase [ubiquinone] 1 alpha subcomplex assembly factor 1
MPRLLTLVVASVALTLAAGAPNPSALAATAEGSAPSTPEANAPLAPLSPPLLMMLFDFMSSDVPRWSVENDGVMGGRSQGFVEVADGTLVFTGEVVTEGGGFTSVRAARQVDLSGYDGIELRVRGGGARLLLTSMTGPGAEAVR